MNLLITSRYLKLGLFCLLLGLVETAVATQPVVEVYGIHYGGKVRYHYRVNNLGVYPISSVWLGHDTLNDTNNYNNVWELKSDISGMFVNKKYPSPDYFDIPPASVTSPQGWEVRRISLEETEEISINWLGKSVMPGQILSGMSVTLDKMDSTYLTSHVTLYRWTPALKAAELTVPLQRIDVAPPALTVTLSSATLPENDRLVPITATLTVADDYDPQPEIKLDSIAVNEVYETKDI